MGAVLLLLVGMAGDVGPFFVQPCSCSFTAADAFMQSPFAKARQPPCAGGPPLTRPAAGAGPNPAPPRSGSGSGRRVTFALDKCPSLPKTDLEPLSAGLEVAELRRFRSETYRTTGGLVAGPLGAALMLLHQVHIMAAAVAQHAYDCGEQ